MGKSMKKHDALSTLKSYQDYRRGNIDWENLLGKGVTPNLIGQAIDHSIEMLDLHCSLNEKTKEDRTSRYPIASKNGKHVRVNL